MSIESVNPTTGERLRRFDPHHAVEVERRLVAAHAAAARWRETPVADRAAVLARAAALLEREKDAFGRLMTMEMGKTLASAVAEAEKCAAGCRYYVQHAERFLADEHVDGADHRVSYQPLGVVLAVMPWNFPFWQVVRFAAPALLAGNVGLLKHASNVPQCALALEDLFARAGAPAGVFQTLLLPASRVEPLIAHPLIAAVTLTGSEAAGRAIARAAGENLKKSVLELGGSDPFVILESADLDAAVESAVKARLINNGQSCIAAKRFIAVAPIYDHFRDAFVAAMKKVTVGDPMQPATALGPLATARLRDDLDDQVQRSVSAGARLLTGGAPRPGAGWFYEPTVLEEIPREAPAHGEELFGPVASLFRARDADHALALANDTGFGLGASVWTRDRAEAERFAARLECGTVFVNAQVASDPRFPFGGVKRSGYGRELALHGMREFQNAKTVRIAL